MGQTLTSHYQEPLKWQKLFAPWAPNLEPQLRLPATGDRYNLSTIAFPECPGPRETCYTILHGPNHSANWGFHTWSYRIDWSTVPTRKSDPRPATCTRGSSPKRLVPSVDSGDISLDGGRWRRLRLSWEEWPLKWSTSEENKTLMASMNTPSSPSRGSYMLIRLYHSKPYLDCGVR